MAHQKRQTVTTKIPIERKGTAFVARSLGDLENSVPVVVAIRDILKLSKTAKEVKEMIKQKMLKINGREVKDYRDSIGLFALFEAGKLYTLILTPQGRFAFEETKNKEYACKVTDKKIFKGKRTQLNFHDGSNILTEEKISVGDTVYLDTSRKIAKHVALKIGVACFVMSGKYAGLHGKVESIENGKIKVHLKEKDISPELEKRSVIAL